jgi:hypothetical protein
MSRREEAAVVSSTKVSASTNAGAGVEQVDGGAGSLFHEPAVKRKRQRDRGRRRWCGVKRRSLPPPPYLYIAG